MRDILHELNYMDNVINRLNKITIYKRPVEPACIDIYMWKEAYNDTGKPDSVFWLFANEYYRMSLEGKV